MPPDRLVDDEVILLQMTPRDGAVETLNLSPPQRFGKGLMTRIFLGHHE